MRRIDSGGYSFYFVLEDSGLMHIERRPGITSTIAIDTFFEGTHILNDVRARFEGATASHGLYWTRLYGNEAGTDVLVLSCFSQENR